MSERLFDKVKNAVPMTEFMAYLGEEGKPFSTGVRYNFCPACQGRCKLVFSVRPNGFGHCFTCGFSGSVIDAHAKMTGQDEMQAAIELSKLFGLDRPGYVCPKPWRPVDPSTVLQKGVERQQALKKALSRLHQALVGRLDSHPTGLARRYLEVERRITPAVLTLAEQRGLLGYLPSDPIKAQALLDQVVGRDLLLASGLMKPEARMAGIAFRPLVFFMPGDSGAEFRIVRAPRDDDEPKSIRYGELRFPYWWQGTTRSVLIVEGAIDLLSVASLGNPTSIMGLPGCQAWQPAWFSRIQARYGISCFLRGLDNDKAGSEVSRKIAVELDRVGIAHRELRPWGGCNDWNDALRAKSTAMLKVVV